MSDDAPKKLPSEPSPLDRKISASWQPFTPQGVAGFAMAPLARILFLQLALAFLAAVVVVWFLNANFVPPISEAIRNLPDAATLQNGKLTNAPTKILAQQKFLALVIDLEQTGGSGQTADLQVELREQYFQICSLFGCGLFIYPKESITLGRATFEPWWGARQPIILAICGALAFVQVWLSWIIFAVIYAPIAKLIAYLTDRELSWGGSWRLASACQMTGALLMTLSIFFYGIQVFDFIRFLFFSALHFVVAWIYLGTALYFLPPVSAGEIPPAKNPFV